MVWSKGPQGGLEGSWGPGDRDTMEQGEKTKKTITQREQGTRQYSSSGMPSTCRRKVIDPHWKPASGSPKALELRPWGKSR